MADTTTLNAGSGGDVIATDDLATLNGSAASPAQKVQRMKVGFGSDGDLRDVDAAHGLPVANVAGEAHIGAVGGNSAVPSGSFVRPANTTAYALGNLVANNTVAASVVPVALAVARVAAGTGVIRRARLSVNNTGLSGTETFRIHLFKTSPTVVNGDGGVFSANGVTSVALGYVDVTMTDLHSDGAKGYSATDIVFVAAGGSQNIYALIEARSAYTPASGSTWTVELEVSQD